MSRYTSRKMGLEILEKIDLNKKDYLIIHYSCEDLYDEVTEKSPRITSIAIKNWSDGNIETFTLHQTAEVMQTTFSSKPDEVEKNMLESFFKFVAKNEEKIWIHWNMRDSNYGFKAIEHRCHKLGGEPIIIPNDKKIELSLLFKQIYGDWYIDHPRIDKLAKLNKIDPKNFLLGAKEAEAFKDSQFKRISMSTISKVNTFYCFLTLAIDERLVVQTKKSELYGTSLNGKFLLVKENLWFKIIFGLVSLIFTTYIGILIERFILRGR